MHDEVRTQQVIAEPLRSFAELLESAPRPLLSLTSAPMCWS